MLILRELVRPRSAILLALLLICASATEIRAADNDYYPCAHDYENLTVNCNRNASYFACKQCSPLSTKNCCYIPPHCVALGFNTCRIIARTSSAAAALGDIGVKQVFSGLSLEYSRKEIVSGNQLLVTFKLKGELRLPGLPTRRIDARGMLSGEDASVGSLAYAVGFIGGGEAALGQLQAQGNDLSLQMTAPPVTCQSSLGTANCNVLAQQMAGLISAALPEGSAAQDSFIESIEPLGYASCGEYVGNDIGADTKDSATMSLQPESASAPLD